MSKAKPTPEEQQAADKANKAEAKKILDVRTQRINKERYKK